jgi:hypothetical protein
VGQTDNATKRERQKEITYIVIVITCAKTEVKYNWNVRKGRRSMPGREYVMSRKTSIAMVLNISSRGDVQTKGNPLKQIAGHTSYAHEERMKLTRVT